MRTKEQMMDLIMGIARDDERVCAVYMDGSVPKGLYKQKDTQ